MKNTRNIVRRMRRLGFTFRMIDRIVFGLRGSNGTKSFRISQ